MPVHPSPPAPSPEAPITSIDDRRVPQYLRILILASLLRGWWWDVTVNPFRHCTPVSAGCRNCWAIKMIMERLSKQIAGAYTDVVGPTFVPEALLEYAKDRVPKRIFTPSMSDPYHDDFTDEQIAAYHDAMDAAAWHFYFSSTSRPDRLAEIGPYLSWGEHKIALVSVEDAATLPRIEKLLACGATRKGVGFEPIIEPLPAPGSPSVFASAYVRDLIRELDYVIVGGETADEADCLPMHLVHARALRDVCLEEGVPFFFKQIGDIDFDGHHVGRKKAGRVLDGRTHDDLPRGCLDHLVRAQAVAAALPRRRRTSAPAQPAAPSEDSSAASGQHAA